METANDEGNYIGVVRGLMSEQEVERMKEKAKGNMKATPYQVGNQDHEFSYKRSSKVRMKKYGILDIVLYTRFYFENIF